MGGIVANLLPPAAFIIIYFLNFFRGRLGMLGMYSVYIQKLFSGGLGWMFWGDSEENLCILELDNSTKKIEQKDCAEFATDHPNVILI